MTNSKPAVKDTLNFENCIRVHQNMSHLILKAYLSLKFTVNIVLSHLQLVANFQHPWVSVY